MTIRLGLVVNRSERGLCGSNYGIVFVVIIIIIIIILRCHVMKL